MRLILIALCLVAAGFYIKTLFPIESGTAAEPVASADAPVSAAKDESAPVVLRPVPESQLAVIRDVFAPEMD